MHDKSRWSLLALSVLAVFALFAGCMGNRVPEILSVIFTPAPPAASDTTEILCNANDPDGDSLSFFWEVSAGMLVDEHANPAIWLTPPEGNYRVKVSVSDNRGGIVYNSQNVDVQIPPAEVPTPVLLNDPTNVIDTSLVLTWTQNRDNDFDHYEVHQSIAPGFAPDDNTLIETIDARAETTHTVTGLTGHVNYYFKVVVVDTSSLSAASNEAHAYTMGPPPTAVVLRDPSNIKDRELSLIWTQNMNTDFVEYEVHRSTVPNFLPDSLSRVTRLARSTDTTYTITGLTPGTTYYCKILVRNLEGRTAVSNQVYASTNQYFVSGEVHLQYARCQAVKYAGGAAYVAGDYGGLFLISTDPTNPLVQGQYTPQVRCHDVDYEGGYAFVAFDTLGLVIFGGVTPISFTNTFGAAYSVTVQYPYAFVGVYEQGLFAAVRVIDISNVGAPVIVGSCFLPASVPWDLAVASNHVYVANDVSGLTVINISTPTVPEVKGSYDVMDKAYGVAYDNGFVYMASGQEGLVVVNVMDEMNPTRISSYDTPGYARGIALFKPIAYVADGDAGLQVFDIADPTSPLLKSTANTGGSMMSVDATSSYAYLGDENNRFLIVGW